ncbi:alanine racemase [Oikeobacillus pervagus]|uniref:Alanine racemase n=1 Tax=Oikeobacillus pervagus TaxID=1325931 RepID=A0AAJ1WKJ2_9BACI|nr:alanine racemase [Oikeobacillus pervagus]MDQ0216588.1 alanine racemase [Oikeobacillus pervagus]
MSNNHVFFRDTWAEIQLDHIKFNVIETKKLLPEDVDLFAVVKANAYGHGDVQVAHAALGAGASGLAVAVLDEALALRKKGVTSPILVLGASRPEDAVIAAENRISLTVFQMEWLKQAEPQLQGKMLNVHLKCDTGMGRLGIKTEKEIKTFETYLASSSVFRFEGVFTHFATADEVEMTYFTEQLGRFQSLISFLRAKPKYIHCANSATTLRHSKAYFNAVRLGISMYGLSPSNEMKPLLPFQLKPAFSLHTKVVHIKKVHAGEKISYGATYEASGDEWIATLPIGYADGWIRKLQGQEVLVNGQRAPIVGRICMDQCMIRLNQEVSIGTKVTLIGKQGDQEITMDEIAETLETIDYEVPCIITSRVPRVYIENGQVQSIDNKLLPSIF